MRLIAVVMALAVAAAGATWYRYKSFHPCDWMAQDLGTQTGLPDLVVQTRITAHFLLQGITDPDPVECLLAWWDIRQDGLPPES